MLKKFIGNRDFYRRTLAIMIPVLIQNVITNFVSLLDNIMVGRIGTEPMSGVAIVNQILFVYNLCVFGGMGGAGILTAQYYGKGDDEGVRNSMRTKLYVAAGVLAVAMAVCIGFGTPLINLFIHEGEDALDLAATLEYGVKYLRIMLLQMPFFALLNVYSSTLRETGETKVPMNAGIAALFVNLFFNYMLIYGKLGAPKLGVVGAAIATVIARVVECGIVVVYTHVNSDRHSFARGLYRSAKVPKSMVVQILKMGLPLLINELFWSSGMTLQTQAFSLTGLETVSAQNICNTVSNLFFCSYFAMGTTVSIVIGQLLGAGKSEEAVDENRKLIAFSMTLAAAVALVMLLLSPYIPRIYNTTATVRALATKMLIINAVMMPVNACLNCSFFAIRAGGRSMLTFLYDSGFVWFVALPLSYILVKCTSLHIIPIYAIVYGTEVIKMTAGLILIKKRIWVRSLVAE